MPRLYYDPSVKEQPYRHRMTVSSDQAAKQYLEKVAKLVPSEILAAYLTVVGLVPLVQNGHLRAVVYAASFLTCLVVTPLYFTSVAEKYRPKRNHIVLSTIAFAVWAYAVSGSTMIPHWHDPAIASILLILFTLVSGRIPLK